MTSMGDCADPDTGEVWVSSERRMVAEVRQSAKSGPLIGPRLVVTDQPESRKATFGVVTDNGDMRIRISIKMARRLAQFILDHTEGKKQVPDGVSDPDPSPSADKPGKHADGAKGEQTKATEEEAEELYERWKRQYEEGRR